MTSHYMEAMERHSHDEPLARDQRRNFVEDAAASRSLAKRDAWYPYLQRVHMGPSQNSFGVLAYAGVLPPALPHLPPHLPALCHVHELASYPGLTFAPHALELPVSEAGWSSTILVRLCLREVGVARASAAAASMLQSPCPCFSASHTISAPLRGRRRAPPPDLQAAASEPRSQQTCCLEQCTISRPLLSGCYSPSEDWQAAAVR